MGNYRPQLKKLDYYETGDLPTFAMSLEENDGVVSLVNDEETPLASCYYGTDENGNKGFFQLPSGIGHDPVSLDTNTVVLFSLTSQELGLNTQSANKVFASPSSGDPDIPTFRSLVNDDLPDEIDAEKIADGSVSNTEFQYLSGLSDNIQNQLDNKVGLSGNETISGVKTFSSFPVLPSSSPSTDYQAVHKKYVDNLVSQNIVRKEQILDMDLTTPPSSKDVGDRYHIASAGNHDIFDIRVESNAFVIDGDVSSFYNVGEKILVRSSPANNGWYSLSDVVYYSEFPPPEPPHMPNTTELVCAETIPDASPAGKVHYSSGAWKLSGVGKLVTWDGTYWVSDGTPNSSWVIAVKDENKLYYFDDIDYEWKVWYSLSSFTFKNGLTQDGANIKLGGSLTEDTTISLEDYDLIFDINDTGRVGIGTNSPNSYLTLGGSRSDKVDVITSNTTLNDTHHTIFADASSVLATLQITLPSSGSCIGREYTIKKIDSSSNTVKIAVNGTTSDTIDGKNYYELVNRYDFITLKAGDGNWCITSKSTLSSHASTHLAGGSDPITGGNLNIKLDDLATPDDNTDLDASTSRHGLLRKLSGNSSQYLDGSGNWSTPTGSPISLVKLTSDRTNSTTNYNDATGLSFSLAANKTYAFEFYVVFKTAATTTGIKLSINGAPSPNFIVFNIDTPTTATARTLSNRRAYNTGAATASIDTANATTLAKISGVISNGANTGTLVVRFASEVAGSNVTIVAGSGGVLYQLD